MTSRWFSLGTPVSATNKPVQQTQSEVLKQEHRFTNEATLPMCCQLNKDYLTYDPKYTAMK
jgi:hypothetical protein